jgi:hypothetical protein
MQPGVAKQMLDAGPEFYDGYTKEQLAAWSKGKNAPVQALETTAPAKYNPAMDSQAASAVDIVAQISYPGLTDAQLGELVVLVKRFSDLLRSPWEGVIRAKGMFWLATRMELAGYVSQAGVLRDTRAMGFFWSAVSEAEWPVDPQSRAEIEANLQVPYGDRRSEIVIIGREMDREALTAKFDAALLSEAEFAKGPNAWMQLPDPFPQWVPADPHSHDNGQ